MHRTRPAGRATPCLAADTGVEYRTAGPWVRDGKELWGQTVVSWQRGFEIMVLSTNVHEEGVSRDGAPARAETTRVADQQTIPMIDWSHSRRVTSGSSPPLE